jgi:hypothetical protein
MRLEAESNGSDNPNLLGVAADGYAPPAKNALGVVPHKVKRGILDLLRPKRLVSISLAHGVDAQIGCSCSSSHFPFRMQVRQSIRWLERISSSVIRLEFKTASVLVRTSIPSLTGYTQEATRLRTPFTSTTQIRQAPISLIPFR